MITRREAAHESGFYVTTEELGSSEIPDSVPDVEQTGGFLKWASRANWALVVADLALTGILVGINYSHENAKRDVEITGIEAAVKADGFQVDVEQGRPGIWLTPDRSDRSAQVDLKISPNCVLMFTRVEYTGDRTHITDIPEYVYNPFGVYTHPNTKRVVIFKNLADLEAQPSVFPLVCEESK